MARKRRDPGTGQLDLFSMPDEPAVPPPAPPPPSTPEPAMFPDQPTEPTLPPPAVPESNKAPETPKAPEAPQEGPRLTLVPPDDCPPPPDTPPEVAADVRAMFLEEEERQRAEETITIREGRPPLVTGIYRKPRPAAQQPLVMP
ncbi:MAG: hypothetical protein IKQ55_01875, partial [Kiritimatiellae bacterium]|nr:hypothetical protein [Kiritimatiellia bacterium]